ncbi:MULTISPECIES: metallophosphoesterase [Enterococcus]|uniref:Calcineurin-like phosphoesterase n=1 Tax=Candidatus Enterococcus ferrettii TaxID=2815324 RepID=A0ABV0EY70_9ENTE|nr:metallophosphoesterase [Enterococcus sp. 665A]MBO1338705.1 metallophosphoesterase family protein [Enterococcus sp. 665A]
MKFFIGDTHFFHENLLGDNDFAPRLFDTVEEMNQQLVASWNAVVKEKDTVYHVGDVAMHPNYEKGNQEILDQLLQLKGKIVFIKGNHDSRAFFNFLAANDPMMLDGTPKFAFHDVGAIVKFNHHQYYLTHYPMLLGTTLNIRNLHGHIHHYSIPIAEDINVGVDAPERDLLPDKLPFGTPLSEHMIDNIAEAKAREVAKLT